jgi:uncharacterized protein YkwD
MQTCETALTLVKTMIKKFSIIILLFISTILRPNTSRDLGPEPKLDLNKINKYILLYTNMQRRYNGLVPLTYDEILEKAAIWQSKYCAYIRNLSHTSNVTGMYSFSDRIRAYGGKSFRTGGENVIVVFSKNTENVSYYIEKDKKGTYYDYGNYYVYWRNEMQVAYKMVDGWMKSPGHRANILTSAFLSMGGGSAKGVYSGEKSYYGTQVFTSKRKYNFNELKSKRVKKENKIYYEIQYPKILKVKILDYNTNKSLNLINPKVIKEENGIVFYEFHKPSKYKGQLIISLVENDPLVIYPMYIAKFK